MKATPEIEAELQRLAIEGRLTPRDVVAEAKNPESPLHHAGFTWDVDKAAQERWEDQARELIRSVYIEIEDEEVVLKTPRYVHDPRAEGQGYIEVSRISDKDHAREIIGQELSRALGNMRRANAVAGALGLSSEMESLISHTTNVREEAEARQ